MKNLIIELRVYLCGADSIPLLGGVESIKTPNSKIGTNSSSWSRVKVRFL